MARGHISSAGPASSETRASKALVAAAGLVAVAVLGLVLWLGTSGAPAPAGAVVALPPVAVVPTAETPVPQPAGTAEGSQQQVSPFEPAPVVQPPGFNEGRALLPAPDPDLIEKGGTGFLPIIGRDGRQPWQVYARPFDLADKRPRIAIVISSLGVSPTATDTAINHLPAAVTLAFVPYKRRLGEWINLTRAAGHEVLLDLPMEPADYPREDPGPNALLTALDPPQNMERLNWVMSQATGYVGMIALMGSRFSTSRDDMLPILTSLKRRGLLFVDNRSSPQTTAPTAAADVHLAFASAGRLLDADPSRSAIDKKLSELEDLARHDGSALGVAQHPYPVIMERVAVWAQTLEDRGLVLAPVSAVVDRPKPAEASTAKPPAGKGAEPAAKPER
jgi:polysaccharide deacetylase 2 family uncharacterized protein YibQ